MTNSDITTTQQAAATVTDTSIRPYRIGVPQAEIAALVDHVKKWSPVANTFIRPVNLEVGI